jgi:hypothetical protein
LRTRAERLVGLAVLVAGVLAWRGGIPFASGICVLALACWALHPAWPTTWALAIACLAAALATSVSTSQAGAADRLTLAFLLLMTAATVGMGRAHRAEEVAAEDVVSDAAT